MMNTNEIYKALRLVMKYADSLEEQGKISLDEARCIEEAMDIIETSLIDDGLEAE